MIALVLLWMMPFAAQSDDLWVKPGPDGQPHVQLYFFWSPTCPHCLEARPFVEAIPAARPWVTLHSLELTRHPEHARQYQDNGGATGAGGCFGAGPAVLRRNACGLGQAETTGAEIARRLDECHARAARGQRGLPLFRPGKLSLPVLGEVDPQHFSLPLLTLAIAGWMPSTPAPSSCCCSCFR